MFEHYLGLRRLQFVFYVCPMNMLCSALVKQGPESDELASASRLEDDVNFYQTVNPDVAKHFHIDSEAKRPALVLVKKEDEKLSHFG